MWYDRHCRAVGIEALWFLKLTSSYKTSCTESCTEDGNTVTEILKIKSQFYGSVIQFNLLYDRKYTSQQGIVFVCTHFRALLTKHFGRPTWRSLRSPCSVFLTVLWWSVGPNPKPVVVVPQPPAGTDGRHRRRQTAICRRRCATI